MPEHEARSDNVNSRFGIALAPAAKSAYLPYRFVLEPSCRLLNDGFWHIASFRCRAVIWSLLTEGDIGRPFVTTRPSRACRRWPESRTFANFARSPAGTGDGFFAQSKQDQKTKWPGQARPPNQARAPSSNLSGFLHRNAILLEQRLQFASLEHLADDVATADELALDIELGNGRPVRKALDAAAQIVVLENVETLVGHAQIIEDLHHLPRKSAHRKLRRSLHEQNDVVGLHLIVDELFDGHRRFPCWRRGPGRGRLIVKAFDAQYRQQKPAKPCIDCGRASKFRWQINCQPPAPARAKRSTVGAKNSPNRPERAWA